MHENRLQKLYSEGVGKRSPYLERVREYAAHTIASIARPEGDGADAELLQSYQNLGADGVANLVNKTLMIEFPAYTSFFRQVPSAKAYIALAGDPETLLQFEQRLYSRELLIRSKLDASNFRVKERVALEQIYVAGNTLTQVLSNYNVRCFRIDQWVQKMTSDFTLKYLVIEECVDPQELPPEIVSKAALKPSDFEGKDYDKRLHKMYTYVEVQSDGSVNIDQEINGHIVSSTNEKVSPFIHGTFHEIPGEDYARGLIELKMGDLRSLNGLAKSILDNAALASRNLIACDETKGVRPADLTKRNGSIFAARVTGGVIEGVGILKSDKHQDFTVTLKTAEMIGNRLGRSLLLDLENQPRGERVTATQISMISSALSSAMGGIFPQVVDSRQTPFVKRIIHQMEKDKLLVPLPKEVREAVDVQIITGVEAMGRTTDLEKLMQGLQLLANIPGGLDGLRMDTVINRILEGTGVNTEGLLLSEEEKKQKQQAAMQQAMQMMAGQKAIDTVGNVAEAQATAAPQAQPAM